MNCLSPRHAWHGDKQRVAGLEQPSHQHSIVELAHPAYLNALRASKTILGEDAPSADNEKGLGLSCSRSMNQKAARCINCPIHLTFARSLCECRVFERDEVGLVSLSHLSLEADFGWFSNLSRPWRQEYYKSNLDRSLRFSSTSPSSSAPIAT